MSTILSAEQVAETRKRYEMWYKRGVTHCLDDVIPELCDTVEALRAALKNLHDECSYLERERKYLNMGPMLEPSDESVLAARRLLMPKEPA